jgi:hypothetical protein
LEEEKKEVDVEMVKKEISWGNQGILREQEQLVTQVHEENVHIIYI